MRRVIIPVAAVLVLAGCGGSGDDATSGAPTPATTTPASTSSATPSATPSRGPSPAPAATVYDGSDDEYFSFHTPSRNIVCAVYPSEANVRKGSLRCDVLSGTWPLPPEPGDCEFDWNRSMLLEEGAQAGACVSDAVDQQGARSVAYNTGVRWHNIVCLSQPSGLTCTNTDNQAGFTVSRSAYTLRG